MCIRDRVYVVKEAFDVSLDKPLCSRKRLLYHTPVSYTHLDVYKRQPVIRSSVRQGGLSTQRHTHLAVGGFRVLAPDVYKRQV